MKNKKLYVFFFILLLIVYNKFLEFKPLQEFSNGLVAVVFYLLLGYTFLSLSYKKGVFIRPIKYIIYSFFIGAISCVIIWDQDLFKSITAIAPYSYFLLFLFLVNARIDPEQIVKIILFLSFVCLGLYLYQTINNQEVFFGYKEEVIEDRGLIRFVFPGEGFMFFALFYYLNKLGQKFSIKYLFLFLPFLWMLLIQVTRMYILAFGLIAIYHFMIKSKIQYRVLVLLVFVLGYSYYNNTDNKVIRGIREATDNDIDQKEDYIRVMEAEYFLFQFSNNNASYFLGNGAYNFSSYYGKKLLRLREDNNYYLEDVGLIKGYILFGVLFVLGYIMIYSRSFTKKIPYKDFYLKYYIWMMLILSFTTRGTTDAGFGAVFAVVLYLFDQSYLEQKRTSNTVDKIKYKRVSQL